MLGCIDEHSIDLKSKLAFLANPNQNYLTSYNRPNSANISKIHSSINSYNNLNRPFSSYESHQSLNRSNKIRIGTTYEINTENKSILRPFSANHIHSIKRNPLFNDFSNSKIDSPSSILYKPIKSKQNKNNYK